MHFYNIRYNCCISVILCDDVPKSKRCSVVKSNIRNVCITWFVLHRILQYLIVFCLFFNELIYILMFTVIAAYTMALF
jgi:hypothetical protein